jgi:hypothetical protein
MLHELVSLIAWRSMRMCETEMPKPTSGSGSRYAPRGGRAGGGQRQQDERIHGHALEPAGLHGMKLPDANTDPDGEGNGDRHDEPRRGATGPALRDGGNAGGRGGVHAPLRLHRGRVRVLSCALPLARFAACHTHQI